MQSTDPVSARHRVAWLGGFALLALLLVAQGPLQVLVTDSGRDLANALAILRGEAFPLRGPELNGIWHLGPAWYYLLAAMLALGGSVTGAGMCLALFASSKLWFAYRFGDELGGRLAGLATAALIALPGWPSLGQIVLSHTSLVEPACTATLWLAVRGWRRCCAFDALAAALVAALAVHAHPTALIVMPCVFAALLRTAVRRRLWWLPPAALLAFAMPFVPMLVAEAAAGWPQIDASHAYATASPWWQRWLAIPQLPWGLTFGQAEWVRHFLFADSIIGRLWQGASLLGIGLAAGGLVYALRRPGPLRWLLPYAILSLVAIGLLRDSAPAWMFYPLSPLAAAIGALALLSPLSSLNRPRLVTLLVLIAVATNAMLLVARWQIGGRGLAPQHTLTLGDIRRHGPIEAPSPWLPLAGHDALTRRLCNAGKVALHGDLATVYHSGQGVAATLGCEHRDALRLGGMQAQHHVVGVPRAIAASLALPYDQALFGFALLTPREVLHPRAGIAPQPHTGYLRTIYVDAMRTSARKQRDFEVDCTPGELLLFTNLAPLLNQATVRIERGSVTLTPVARTLASAYYACDGPLRIRLEALDLPAVQLLRLQRGD